MKILPLWALFTKLKILLRSKMKFMEKTIIGRSKVFLWIKYFIYEIKNPYMLLLLILHTRGVYSSAIRIVRRWEAFQTRKKVGKLFKRLRKKFFPTLEKKKWKPSLSNIKQSCQPSRKNRDCPEFFPILPNVPRSRFFAWFVPIFVICLRKKEPVINPAISGISKSDPGASKEELNPIWLACAVENSWPFAWVLGTVLYCNRQ